MIKYLGPGIIILLVLFASYLVIVHWQKKKTSTCLMISAALAWLLCAIAIPNYSSIAPEEKKAAIQMMTFICSAILGLGFGLSVWNRIKRRKR